MGWLDEFMANYGKLFMPKWAGGTKENAYNPTSKSMILFGDDARIINESLSNQLQNNRQLLQTVIGSVVPQDEIDVTDSYFDGVAPTMIKLRFDPKNSRISINSTDRIVNIGGTDYDITKKDDVIKLQQLLASYGFRNQLGNYGNRGIDGKFGRNTATALRNFAEQYDILGGIDYNEYRKSLILTPPPPVPPTPPQNDNIYYGQGRYIPQGGATQTTQNTQPTSTTSSSQANDANSFDNLQPNEFTQCLQYPLYPFSLYNWGYMPYMYPINPQILQQYM